MDENKKDVLEDEALEETAAEETIEAENEDEVVIYGDEEADEAEVTEAVEAEYDDEIYTKYELLSFEVEKLKKKNKVLTAIIALVVCAALVFGGFKVYKTVYNPYNHMGYYNISEMTLADFAAMYNASVEEIIDEFDLPEDIKADTYYDVIQYLVPVSTVAKINGVDVDTLKVYYGFADEVTGEYTWGEAIDTLPISAMLTDVTFEEFAKEYNLAATITAETPWGKVRKIVNKVDYEKFLAEKATDVSEPVEDVTELN